jgi:hypothetical protein
MKSHNKKNKILKNSQNLVKSQNKGAQIQRIHSKSSEIT